MSPIFRRRARRPLLVVLAATICAASSTATPAQAAAGERAAPRQVQVTGLQATSTAIESGTRVRTSTAVRRVAGSRQPSGVVRLYLVGGGRVHDLAVARTPSLAPGERAVVRTTARAPLSVPAGRYAVAACVGRPGDGVCRTSRPTVVVRAARLTASPDALDLGDSPSGGGPVTREVTITNAGHTPTGRLTVEIRHEGPGRFGVSENPCEASLAPGRSCTATVTYTPGAAPGTASGTLVLQGTSARVAVDLTARTGAAASARIDPATYDYGSVAVGSGRSMTFRFVNDTDTDSQLLSGDFADPFVGFVFDYREGQNSCLDLVVPANGSCTFSVAFQPVGEGTVSTTVTFTGTGLDPATAVLTGTGTAGARPAPAAPPRSRDYVAGVR